MKPSPLHRKLNMERDALRRLSRPGIVFSTSILLVVALVIVVFVCNAEDEERRTVTRVIDGDTIILDGGERVRLIGVDTPESVHPSKPVEEFSKEASAFTKRLAEGKKVRLQHDRETATHDRYGRTLAYVYLPDDSLLNLEIIRRGYGHAYTRFPFSMMDEFRKAEGEAREARRGLWAIDNEEEETRSTIDDPTDREDEESDAVKPDSPR